MPTELRRVEPDMKEVRIEKGLDQALIVVTVAGVLAQPLVERLPTEVLAGGVQGVARFGQPRFVDTIKSHLIDIKDDGSFRLNLDLRIRRCSGSAAGCTLRCPCDWACQPPIEL